MGEVRMMRMMKGTLQLFAAAALIAFGANNAQASEDASHELRIVNNSTVSVSVYVQDAAGRMHRLDRVASDKTVTMEVPADIAAAGAFQIKVVPIAPVWSPWTSGEGIRTHDLNLPEGAAITLRLEEDLQESQIEVVTQ
jgi:hypothetical protein